MIVFSIDISGGSRCAKKSALLQKFGQDPDKYYGIFSGVNYANLVAERTARTVAKATASSTAQEIAEELEKMLVEKASKKKIGEFIKRLKEK